MLVYPRPWLHLRLVCLPQNKVQHLKVLQSRGFRFMVHPEAFIVHRPHELSRSRAVYTSGQPLLKPQSASTDAASLHNITTRW